MTPTLAASSQKNSVNTTTNLVADAMTIQTGDVIVVKAGTWQSSLPPTASAPSATGLTFTQRAAETGGGFNGNMYLWTAVAGSALGSTVVTLPGPASSCHHAMSVEVWRNAQLAASPVVATYFDNGGTAPSWNLTTAAADSVVTWGLYDNNTASPTGRTYRSSAVEIGGTFSSADGIFYWAYQAVVSAGSTTMGLTFPTNMRSNAAAIEIQAAAGAAPAGPIVPISQYSGWF